MSGRKDNSWENVLKQRTSLTCPLGASEGFDLNYYSNSTRFKSLSPEERPLQLHFPLFPLILLSSANPVHVTSFCYRPALPGQWCLILGVGVHFNLTGSVDSATELTVALFQVVSEV